MSYRIAICDDRIQDAEFVQKILQHWAAKRQISVQARVFPSAESFLFAYAEDKNWDILLLDIEMGAMDGVTMAKTVRRDNETVQIIFITGYSDYIAEGYEVAALHYLMKPVSEEKLMAVLDRAAEKLEKKEQVLMLPVDGETVRLPVAQIQYVEAFAHSVRIVTGEESLSVKLSISELEKQLGDGFVRCHRSYLVGLRHVARISRTEITMDDGQVLPIARSATALVHKAFVAYYAGEDDETL